MKTTVIIAAVLAALCVLIPLAALAGDPFPAESAPPEQSGPQPDASPRDAEISETEPRQEDQTAPGRAYEDLDVRVMTGGEVVVMKLEDYLTGVVAAEMPVDFLTEALKAQAVAARTYTLYRMVSEPSPNHPDADVCDDPGCCKAYLSDAGLRDAWGDSYAENMKKISAAVEATRGEYMTYEGEPILAVFHASSAGMTEESGAVWQRDMPYLVSVKSPETADDAANYVTKVRVSESDFAETVLGEYPDADLSGDPETWVDGITYTQSGRVAYAVVGGVGIRGTKLRSMFGLRSTHMEIAAEDGDIVFTVTGSGHGVGMSQYGANVLAKQGYGCRDILLRYYSGIDFANLNESADSAA